jgi:hypothetical protein
MAIARLKTSNVIKDFDQLIGGAKNSCSKYRQAVRIGEQKKSMPNMGRAAIAQARQKHVYG